MTAPRQTAPGRTIGQTGGVLRRPRIPLALLALLALPACNPQLNLGNSILWSARHESGELSEWTEGGKGGTAADMPDTSLAVSTDFAHTGQYSVKLTNGAVSMSETAHLWRQDDYPPEAYYSAGLYLPRAYQTTADWSLGQFQVPPNTDGGAIGQP